VRVPRTGSDLTVAKLVGDPGGESREFEWLAPDLPGLPLGQAHHQAVFDAIRGDSPPRPGEYGMAVLEVCAAIRRSAAAATWVDVSSA